MKRWSVLVLGYCSAIALSSTLPAPQQTVHYALTPSDIPKPLSIGWANRMAANYYPSAATPDGLPPPKTRYSGGKKLSLTEAILLALRNNPDVLSAQMQRVTDKFNFEIAKYNYSPRITSTLTANASVDTGQPLSYSTSITPTVSMDLPWGTNISLDYSPEVNFLHYIGDGTGALSIVQPLLQGFNQGKRELLNAEDAEETAKMAYQDSVTGIVNQVVTNYLSLLKAQMNEKIQANSLKSAQQSFRFAQLNLKAGKTSPSNFRQSKASYLQSELAASNQRDNLRDQYEKFFQFIGVSLKSNLKLPDDINYKTLPMQYPPLKQAVAMMLQMNTGYRKALLGMYKIQRGLVDSRQALWPTLKLSMVHYFGQSANAGGSSSIPVVPIIPSTRLQAPLSASGWSPVNNNSASLDFSMPIDNYQKKINLLKARIFYEQSKLQLAKTKQDLIFSLQQDYKTVLNDKKQLSLAKSSVDIQTQVVKDAQLKYRFGKTTAFELSTLRDNLLTTEQSSVDAEIQYFTDVNRIHTDIGDGLDVWHIKLRY